MVYTNSIFHKDLGIVELTGATDQHQMFEKGLRSIDGIQSLSENEIMSLALACGLVVRITKYNEEKKGMKNLLDKHYFERLRGGVLSDDDVQLLLDVLGPMLAMDTDYTIVKKEELKKEKKEQTYVSSDLQGLYIIPYFDSKDYAEGIRDTFIKFGRNAEVSGSLPELNKILETLDKDTTIHLPTVERNLRDYIVNKGFHNVVLEGKN